MKRKSLSSALLIFGIPDLASSAAEQRCEIAKKGDCRSPLPGLEGIQSIADLNDQTPKQLSGRPTALP